ncbi:Rep protein [Niallia alba]|uniref:rolling circle replication-associated protein n=1 Tax=Niallia alba TaxID=2729105 RepID=UPI0039A1A90A
MKGKYRAYNIKTIETSSYIEIYQYETPIISKVKENETSKSHLEFLEVENNKKSFEEMNASEQAESLSRKQKHYENMRWEIARLVDCNFDSQTKFLTLTFKENEQDIAFTNDEFRKFIQRLNYRLYKTKKATLHYIATWEKQRKRGAIHYHVILFKFPFIKVKELQTIWGHGFVKINKVEVDSLENHGRYLSKYFAKDLDIKEHKKKAFFKSQNLTLPIVKKFSSTNEMDLTNKNVIYTNEYTQKIPIFKAFSDNGSRNIEFEDRTVKYTKIKKD